MDLIDIVIELGLEGIDEAKAFIEKNWKITGAASSLGAASVLSKNMIKKKYYWQYLDWKYNDVYPAKDLTKHVWISGVQGSGKSNKNRRIFINSFVKQGWGGIYIDTHGTADLVLQSIPPERWKDVIYIAPWMGRVYGINILQRYSDDNGEIDRIAEDVVSVFSKAYPRSWGDKIANCFRLATKAVLMAEEKIPDYKPTIEDVYKMLKQPLFREDILKHVENEVIKDFFETLKATSAIDKLANPLSSENVLLALCQKDGINLLKAMNNKKIIIANLDNNYLSDNANFIAGMLISNIAKCAAKRKENDELCSPYFALAADEFYEYANKHIATIIAQMRKKNVCAILCNQYRDQMPDIVKSAVSMCQFKFIHTPADEDLSYVSSLYKDYFSKEQIIKIPFFSCIQDIHRPGKARNPFISQVPEFKGEYDWEYVHKLKFASLSNAPQRYKLLEEMTKEKVIETVNDTEKIDTGEIFLDGEIDYHEY
jgi:hypothetical protein